MKKIIMFLLIISLSSFMLPAEDVYEFTESELTAYVQEVIEDAFAVKEAEIVELKRNHEISIIDLESSHDKEIALFELNLQATLDENAGLNKTIRKQTIFIRWSPVIIATATTLGVILGIKIAQAL